MSHRSLNQKGFTVIEAVLILIILAIIGGTGYYVYHANSKATDTQNQAQTNANTATPPKKKSTKAATKTQQYITITEWGVRAPYDGNLSLSYVFKHDTGDVTYVAFTSAKLKAQGGICADGSGYGGAISRYKPSEKVLNDGGTPTPQTASALAATLQPSQYGHVDNYYFFYSSPQAACANSQAGQSAQTQTNDAVKALLPKLEAVKS